MAAGGVAGLVAGGDTGEADHAGGFRAVAARREAAITTAEGVMTIPMFLVCVVAYGVMLGVIWAIVAGGSAHDMD